MKKIDILTKSILLLYRESIVDSVAGDSKDLVKNVLNIMQDSKNVMGGEQSIITDLKNMIMDMIVNSDGFDDSTITQTLSIILKDKETLNKAIIKNLTTEFKEDKLKQNILNLRSYLTNYYKNEDIKKIISAASFKLNTGQLGEQSTMDYMEEVLTSLETHMYKSAVKDPGIVDEIDLGDEDSMSDTLEKVKNNVNGTGKFVTGWKELNVMLQGGLRSSEMVMINALQHNYKSGFTRSLFMQLAEHNTPELIDKDKKPLLLYISFEDDADITLDFMYKYLYYNEFDKLPDMDTVTTKEISSYIKAKLTAKGFFVKVLRVNPSEWTYKSIFNKILEYEAMGFEVKATFMDYLAKISTAGCIGGPAGAEYKDLYNRIRNFFTAKQILIVTPHQLSTEAKQLIRQGEPALNFVKTVEGKGYFDHSRALDQIVDLEIYLHKAFINKKPVLTVGRGKHRIPSILDEDKKYFTLKFPKGAPIKENINDEGSIEDAFKNNDDDGDIF